MFYNQFVSTHSVVVYVALMGGYAQVEPRCLQLVAPAIAKSDELRQLLPQGRQLRDQCE